jgi:hypothetical protein
MIIWIVSEGQDDTTTLRELAASMRNAFAGKGGWYARCTRLRLGSGAPEAVNCGEFAIDGVRNRDLQTLLFPIPRFNKAEARRRSATISRKLRLLRAHGILQKLPHTHPETPAHPSLSDLRQRPTHPQRRAFGPTHHHSAAYEVGGMKSSRAAKKPRSNSTAGFYF